MFISRIRTAISNLVLRRVQNKLIITFSGIGIVAVLSIAIYSYYVAKSALRHRTFEQLIAIKEAKRINIEGFIDRKLEWSNMAASSIAMNNMLDSLDANLELEINNMIFKTFMNASRFQSIIVIWDTANFSYGHFDEKVSFNYPQPTELKSHFSKIFKDIEQNKGAKIYDYVSINEIYSLTVAAPCFHSNGDLKAVIAFTLPLNVIDGIMRSSRSVSAFGVTGETYLIGGDLLMRSTSRFNPNSVMNVLVDTKSAHLALSGESNTIVTSDYRNVDVLSSFSPLNIDGLNWAVISEIDGPEILEPMYHMRDRMLQVGFVILLTFILISIWFARHLSRPLVNLRVLSEDIALGNYGNTIMATTTDEVGQLTHSFNEMSQQILEQRLELERKNNEILQSINYAKRIQNGLLPSSRLIDNLLNESFVFFKPKDIIGGDFYYIGEEDDHVVVAVGDCTGHGVPGAFISGISLSALQRTVKGFRIVKPSEILDKLDEIIQEIFSASEMDIKDGMDISICSLHFGKKQLQFAGAHNSMIRIRNNELEEFKADRQAIGIQLNKEPFKNNEFDFQKGDCIYMFTDGYIDQFGGPKKRKYMRKKLKQLLLEIHKEPMTNQKLMLDEELKKWMGDLEQIDDICVFGVRL